VPDTTLAAEVLLVSCVVVLDAEDVELDVTAVVPDVVLLVSAVVVAAAWWCPYAPHSRMPWYAMPYQCDWHQRSR
jgi:hypothetical protein